MVDWEAAFSNQKNESTGRPQAPQGFPQPRREKAAEPVAPEHPLRPTGQVETAEGKGPSRPQATKARKSKQRTRHKTQRKKSTEAFPGRLKRLHNFLDDIWINILLEARERPDTLLVAGATSGEGCMFVAFHLALFLALGHGLKTLYLDLNVNSFSSNPYIPEQPDGLASYFNEHKALESVILETEYENFFVLSSGSGGLENKRQNVIIENEDLDEIIQHCKENFDVAIFSGLPITFRPIMLQAARAVDAVVMVSRYGYSRREVSRLAIDKLRENNAPLLGLILNNREYPVPKWAYKILK